MGAFILTNKLIMTIFEQLIELAPECVKISTDHGFWEEGDKRNKGEMVALICSELYESLEGHRKGKICIVRNDKHVEKFMEDEPNNWISWFKNHVKDTTADEIADAVIRILDYTYGWKLPVLVRDYSKESFGNYAHDLLRLNWYILLAFEEKFVIHPGKDWGYALAAIIKFCEWYNIDIVQHCKWKMRYNASRPHKHGKNY